MVINKAERIFILIHSLGGGGAERVISYLSDLWVREGRSVMIVSMASSSLDAYVIHPEVSRVSLDLACESSGVISAFLSNVRRIIAVRSILKSFKPDVAMGFMATSGVIVGLAGLGLPCRTYAAERTYPPKLPLGAFWECLRRWVYPRVNGVFALTNEGKDWLQKNCRGSKVKVIPNPVVWPLPCGEPVLAVNEYVSCQRKILLAVGRLSSEKQFDLLVDSFCCIAANHPSWDLVILGEGAERTALVDKVHGLGIGDRVFLPGRVGNLSDWYARADLFVLSSNFEGFPNALVEAMAHGCASISFDCDTGPRDIIHDGVNGILVPPKEGGAGLSNSLDYLMANDLVREDMAVNAASVKNIFSVEEIARLWRAELDCQA